SRGSLIQGTNGHSNGIVPWLKTLDASVSAVNQGGKRQGAACVYLEPWHADIEEFLELRDNTGDEARRTHNLNLANWIPDIFMRRVEEDGQWSLFDPKTVPNFPDLYGEEFEAAYLEAEAAGKAMRTIKARDLYARMMRTLAQTGNGWMNFKDKSNRAANQTASGKNIVHSSNLCTEIIEVSNEGETAVCNLGSVNLSRHLYFEDGKVSFDFTKLARTVSTAVRQLDNVIDLNYYTIESTKASNDRWRPVGLGLMGLQDVFYQMRLPFDSAGARELSKRISEEIYFNALTTSCELAQEKGAHIAFGETRAARGELQFDAWGVQPTDPARWDALRQRIMQHGLRNSLLIAIAPTATIASICGASECIEPQVSNLFKRETLSGDFLQINRYLVGELKQLGMWTEDTRNRLKLAEGSVQGMTELPEGLRAVYRTAWELPMASLIDMAADRGAFIDQSQSLNLFAESPNIGQLSSMYFYAWKKGLKTTYYLRSRPATRIAKVNAETPAYVVKAPEAPAPAPVTPVFSAPAAPVAAQPAPAWQSVAAPATPVVETPTPSWQNAAPAAAPVVEAPAPAWQNAVAPAAPVAEAPSVPSWTAAVPTVVAETPVAAPAPAPVMTTPVTSTPPIPVLTGWGAPPPAPAVAAEPVVQTAVMETPAVTAASETVPYAAPVLETPVASWGTQPAASAAIAPAAWGAMPATAVAPVEPAFEVPDFLSASHEIPMTWSLEDASAAVACSLENPESCEACQ
ncbi:MAG: ribonucleoside-diphosphate reductase subunit alpha, partial [Dehalococcoidia bacterium]